MSSGPGTPDSERPAGDLRKTEPVVGVNLDDGVVLLRPCGDDDAEWYAQSTRDTEIQRFTTNPPTLGPEQVLAAIRRVRSAGDEEAFVICDAATGTRLGSIHVGLDGRVGEVSYWLAADARGKGSATRALRLVSSWAFRDFGLQELRLRAHRDNPASQQVAMRAGYHRDPDRDGAQEAKGSVWPMMAFAMSRPGAQP
jgi:[ribosomal protein S5]-alanine N-acetyltransferase